MQSKRKTYNIKYGSKLLLGALLAIASCAKPPKKAPEFHLRFAPISISQYHDTTVSLRIHVKTSPEWEDLKITVRVYSPSPRFKVEDDKWEAIPDTAHDFKITCKTSISGSFPLRIVATAANGQQQSAMCNLYIDGNNDCSLQILGTYINTANGQQSQITLGNNTKEIVVQNLLWNPQPPSSLLDTLYINCTGNVLGRTTKLANIEYTANGTFNYDTIRLTSTVTDDAGKHTFSYSLGRKK